MNDSFFFCQASVAACTHLVRARSHVFPRLSLAVARVPDRRARQSDGRSGVVLRSHSSPPPPPSAPVGVPATGSSALGRGPSRLFNGGNDAPYRHTVVDTRTDITHSGTNSFTSLATTPPLAAFCRHRFVRDQFNRDPLVTHRNSRDELDRRRPDAHH